MSEVEAYFQENNYPVHEAQQFFYYNQGKNWMLTKTLPITDWKAMAKKWMNKPGKTATPKNNPEQDLQFLYESFSEGKKIFHQLQPVHFDLLKLQITEAAIQEAWNERINQVSGTNQHSLSEIWQAYLTGDSNNPLVQKDKPNLIALAKRIAAIKYFYSLKLSGTTVIAIPP